MPPKRQWNPKKVPPAREFERKDGRPVWEGRRTPFVGIRDLSLTRDADLWAAMSTVTFEAQVRVDNMICRTSSEVELTDTACQVVLIQGAGGIGFSREQRPIRFSQEDAERPCLRW